jgi:hypothetical protein
MNTRKNTMKSMATAMAIAGGVAGIICMAQNRATASVASMIITQSSAASIQAVGDPDEVIKWTRLPLHQDFVITHASFSQRGYRLYDDQDETILVPFTDDNLYVMKFGVSPDEDMHFIRSTHSPVLLVPVDGYLSNQDVPGDIWYPFSDSYQPQTPVYYSIAPTWTDYLAIDWYSGYEFHGGYYCRRAFVPGIVVTPVPGLTIIVAGQSFSGWHDYKNHHHHSPNPPEQGPGNGGAPTVHGYAPTHSLGGSTPIVRHLVADSQPARIQ